MLFRVCELGLGGSVPVEGLACARWCLVLFLLCVLGFGLGGSAFTGAWPTPRTFEVLSTFPPYLKEWQRYSR